MLLLIPVGLCFGSCVIPVSCSSVVVDAVSFVAAACRLIRSVSSSARWHGAEDLLCSCLSWAWVNHVDHHLGGDFSGGRLLTRRPAGVHPSRLSGGSGGGGAVSLLFASCSDLLELIPAASWSARVNRSLGPVAESHRSSAAEALAYSRGQRSAAAEPLGFRGGACIRRSLLC